MVIDWNHVRVRLNTVGRSRWLRGVRQSPDWRSDTTSEDFDLWYIWGGRGSIHLHEGWRDLAPGVCIWMRPGWHYDAVQDPRNPICLNFIHFSLFDEKGRGLSPDAKLPPERLEPPDPQMAETITRRMIELTWGFGRHGFLHVSPEVPATQVAQQMLAGLLMELDHASEAAAQSGSLSQLQQRAMHDAACRILEHPREAPSVSELADLAGYSVDHFIRMFRSVTGLTPRKFVVQARTRLAQRMLRETEMPIGDIARAAGYGDIYFFSRQFKQVVGMSPSGYRRGSDGKQTKP